MAALNQPWLNLANTYYETAAGHLWLQRWEFEEAEERAEAYFVRGNGSLQNSLPVQQNISSLIASARQTIKSAVANIEKTKGPCDLNLASSIQEKIQFLTKSFGDLTGNISQMENKLKALHSGNSELPNLTSYTTTNQVQSCSDEIETGC